MNKVPIRRTDTEKLQVGDYYDDVKRYYDQNLEMTVVKLMTGDCYVTPEPREMLVTILGSCVSACMRDPVSGAGGMNHMLLPGNGNNEGKTKGDPGYSTRFGVFAMEELINGILKLGGRKDRLEVKIFGGGNVIKNSAMIGTKNVNFVREFLKNEGIKIHAEHVGGNLPRRIHYFPETGKVMMRELKRKDDLRIVEEEKEYQTKLISKPKAQEAELF
jgi:chemotaxis protein CheD